MPIVKKFLTNYVSEESNGISDRVSKFLFLAIRGIQMRIKMSPEQTYNILRDDFSDKKEFAADAIDLVDEIGLFLSDNRLIDYYDNVPFIHEFINTFHEFAVSDIELGVSSPKFTMSASFQSAGFKELFDLVLDGMQDQ